MIILNHIENIVLTHSNFISNLLIIFCFEIRSSILQKLIILNVTQNGF